MPAYKDKERNTWYCEFRYTKNNERKKKKKRGFLTKKEALEFERNFLNIINNSTQMLLSDLYEIYWEDMKQRLKPSTLKSKVVAFERHILPYFINFSVDNVDNLAIRNWQNDLLKKGYSNTYLRKLCAEFSSFLNYAVKFYNLEKNPFAIVGNIGNTKTEKEFNILTVDQFNKFIKLFEEEKDIYIAFKVLFNTGMRVGELLALNWNDIDFKNRKIFINKSIQRIKKMDHITSPKSKKSIRKIEISTSLTNLLFEFRETFDEFLKENGRIFNFSRHKLLTRSRKAEENGFKRIRVHDFRHSHASFLIAQGIPIPLISERLGHENIQTTLNVYSHVYKDSTEKLIEVLDEI